MPLPKYHLDSYKNMSKDEIVARHLSLLASYRRLKIDPKIQLEALTQELEYMSRAQPDQMATTRHTNREQGKEREQEQASKLESLTFVINELYCALKTENDEMVLNEFERLVIC